MAKSNSLPGLPDDYTSQFFRNDTVVSRTNSSFRGKVLRCWADEDGDMPELPAGTQLHPLDRPLKRGEVGISNLSTGELSILPESSLSLHCREFLKGDVVKHSLTSKESAVIVDTSTKVKLEHAITKVPLTREDGWVDFKLLTNSLSIEARDRVVYGGWIGTIEEVFEDGLIESQIGICYRVAEMGGLLEPGRLAADVIPKDTHEHLSNPLPPFANASVDRVLDVHPVVIYITWNALNQRIPVSEQSNYPEPKQFWYGKEIEDLIHFDSFHTQPANIGATVSFKNEADEKQYGVQVSHHAGGSIRFNKLRIVESRSTLTLRWQDGHETQEMASDVVPYRNVDDYETWPGEHLIWRSDDAEPRHAVVQSFDPHQRVAELLFPDTKETQLVPVLELDPGGRNGTANYGVGFGQQVLLCDNNHSSPPEVPVLGQSETPVNNVWSRHELASLADQYLTDPDKFGYYLPKGDPKSVDWWGEVIQLHLDGTITVELPTGETRRLGIENVFLLNELHEAMFEDELLPGETDEMIVDELGAIISAKRGDYTASDASWETMDEDEAEDGESVGGEEVYMDAQEDVEEEMKHEESIDQMLSAQMDPISTSAADKPGIHPEPSTDTPIGSTPTRQSHLNGTSLASADAISSQPEAGPSTMSNGHAAGDSLEDDEHWTTFEMLEEAPQDHWFIGQSRLESANKAYLSRLKKEHKALMSSLPDNIIVRTYEDRTDLMRVLIIGPEGTPYADAPFVFDVYLNPTKFPNDPPLVHFHSHTNGHGRCNPNLYEDGKVCLSILGTWSGDASESWNPAKSSLLQVFVSISGLVLVRSPYHCEPAFAKLEGTKEGKVNSRLYSEKAYVLSRSFVRTALERPPSGLADEIRHLYLTKGRIRSVIDHANRLIEKGQLAPGEEEENEEMWNSDAMGSLTMGAIITLKRTIGALQRIADKEGSV